MIWLFTRAIISSTTWPVATGAAVAGAGAAGAGATGPAGTAWPAANTGRHAVAMSIRTCLFIGFLVGRHAAWTCGQRPFRYFTTSAGTSPPRLSLMLWGFCQVAETPAKRLAQRRGQSCRLAPAVRR